MGDLGPESDLFSEFELLGPPPAPYSELELEIIRPIEPPSSAASDPFEPAITAAETRRRPAIASEEPTAETDRDDRPAPMTAELVADAREAGTLAVEAAATAESDELPRRWGRSQVPAVLSAVAEKLEREGIDIAALLPEKATSLRAAASLLLRANMTDTDIGAQLGVQSAHVPNMRTRLLETILRNAPDSIDLGELALRGGALLRDPRPHAGTIARALLDERGMTVKELAARMGVSQPTLSRFFSGVTAPKELAEKVMEHLDAPAGIAEAVIGLHLRKQQVRAERAKALRDLRKKHKSR